MSDITLDTFRSDNTIIQECINILKNKNVWVRALSKLVLCVSIGKEWKFNVSAHALYIGKNTFYSDKIYDGMDFKDVKDLYDICYQLDLAHDHEKVQAALAHLAGKSQQSNPVQNSAQNLALFARIRSGFRGLSIPRKRR